MTRFLFALFAALVPMVASAQESPDALVKRVTGEVIAAIKSDKDLQGANPRRVYELAEQKVLPHFNFKHMTQLAVGRHWRDASPEQQKQLTTEFTTLLVRTYSTSLSAYRNQTIDVKPLKMSPQDKEVTVRTAVVQQGGPAIPIDYPMEKLDTGWMVYDVIIDGASLVTTYRGSFNDQIQKGGVDGLVKLLAERNKSPAPAPAKK